MKNIILLLLLTFIIGCNPNTNSDSRNASTMPDTVYIEVPTINRERINELEADVEFWKSKVDSMSTTIPIEDYMNARKIEKVKYYISICEKKSNNKKFFYGWIKRTMAE